MGRTRASAPAGGRYRAVGRAVAAAVFAALWLGFAATVAFLQGTGGDWPYLWVVPAGLAAGLICLALALVNLAARPGAARIWPRRLATGCVVAEWMLAVGIVGVGVGYALVTEGVAHLLVAVPMLVLWLLTVFVLSDTTRYARA